MVRSMNKSKSGWTSQTSNGAFNLALSMVRVLIGTYFLAMATGLILEPGGRMFFDDLLPERASQIASTTYLFVAAFAIMVGFALRPAAVLLAIYVLWSVFAYNDVEGSQIALSVYLRQAAMLGAIALIAMLRPGQSLGGTQRRFRMQQMDKTGRDVARA